MSSGRLMVEGGVAVTGLMIGVLVGLVVAYEIVLVTTPRVQPVPVSQVLTGDLHPSQDLARNLYERQQ